MPDEAPDRDALVPPVVTINDNGDGTFDVIETNFTHSTAISLDQAIQTAKALFGEDVKIEDASTPAALPVAAPEPVVELAPVEPVPVPVPEPVVMPPAPTV